MGFIWFEYKFVNILGENLFILKLLLVNFNVKYMFFWFVVGLNNCMVYAVFLVVVEFLG